MMKAISIRRKKKEAGETVLEFAAAMPLFTLILAGIVMFAWLFWAQAVADIASVRALKEGSINRGVDSVNPAYGTAFFTDSTFALTGGRTSGVIGNAGVTPSIPERTVQLRVNGMVSLDFGPIASLFRFGGGGAGRMWRFWPGPPDTWE